MKQQINAQEAGKRKQIVALILSWVIILGTYLLLRLIFLMQSGYNSPRLAA